MAMLEFSISPDVYGKLVGGALTLIVMGVGYIARQAHSISETVGKTSRTLFGEDGKTGLHLTVQSHGDQIDDHEERLIRVEANLDMPRTRHRDSNGGGGGHAA